MRPTLILSFYCLLLLSLVFTEAWRSSMTVILSNTNYSANSKLKHIFKNSRILAWLAIFATPSKYAVIVNCAAFGVMIAHVLYKTWVA